MMGLLNIVSQYYYAFGMVKFYSEKLKFLLVLCVLWSLKLVLSRMATKLPFLVLFWFLCSGNATNLFVGSSYSSCWTTKMLVLIWRLLVGNVRLLNSKPTLQRKIQKHEDSNQGSYMVTLRYRWNFWPQNSRILAIISNICWWGSWWEAALTKSATNLSAVGWGIGFTAKSKKFVKELLIKIIFLVGCGGWYEIVTISNWLWQWWSHYWDHSGKQFFSGDSIIVWKQKDRIISAGMELIRWSWWWWRWLWWWWWQSRWLSWTFQERQTDVTAKP